MTKTVYKRCSVTLDLGTIQRAKELSSAKGQSVSSVVRYLVGEAYEEHRRTRDANKETGP